ncbi:MAG: hypothetical protein ABIJ65_08470 [Chloroflexota bacterium]
MQKAGRSMGRWMNNLVKSDTWKLVRQASNKIKYLPNELMREAGLEDIKKTSQEFNKEISKEISQELTDPFKAWKEPNMSATKPGGKSPISENIIDPSLPEKNNGGDEDA